MSSSNRERGEARRGEEELNPFITCRYDGGYKLYCDNGEYDLYFADGVVVAKRGKQRYAVPIEQFSLRYFGVSATLIDHAVSFEEGGRRTVLVPCSNPPNGHLVAIDGESAAYMPTYVLPNNKTVWPSQNATLCPPPEEFEKAFKEVKDQEVDKFIAQLRERLPPTALKAFAAIVAGWATALLAKRRLITVITGPTGIGKTNVLTAVASLLGGEEMVEIMEYRSWAAVRFALMSKYVMLDDVMESGDPREVQMGADLILGYYNRHLIGRVYFGKRKKFRLRGFLVLAGVNALGLLSYPGGIARRLRYVVLLDKTTPAHLSWLEQDAELYRLYLIRWILRSRSVDVTALSPETIYDYYYYELTGESPEAPEGEDLFVDLLSKLTRRLKEVRAAPRTYEVDADGKAWWLIWREPVKLVKQEASEYPAVIFDGQSKRTVVRRMRQVVLYTEPELKWFIKALGLPIKVTWDKSRHLLLLIREDKVDETIERLEAIVKGINNKN